MTSKLESSLAEWKDLLGEKKFNNRIKKAVKILTEGIEKNKNESPTIANKPIEKIQAAIDTAKKDSIKKKSTNKTVSIPAKKTVSKKKSSIKPVVAAKETLAPKAK
ncbi:MAG: hypothetical protein QM530_09510 [Phycisphaerales bacterium]|nr:hypothetical protein [Phycisphaerales bacterium]